jgi:hypothetical protein
MNQFSAGAVLARSVGIWAKNLVPFIVISLIANIPALLYTWLAGGSVQGVKTWSSAIGIVGLLTGNIATGAIVYGVLMQLRGQAASIGHCISVGVGRMFPIIGVAICAGLAVGVGFVLLIVPGLIVMTMLYVAVPVAVVERPGVFASLNRSSQLTEGNRWPVFGVVFVQLLVTIGISYLFNRQMMGSVTSLGELRTYMMVSQLIGVVLGSLAAVFTAVCYHDLKSSKEGVGVEQLLAVFS